jgi:hypothetical protein
MWSLEKSDNLTKGTSLACLILGMAEDKKHIIFLHIHLSSSEISFLESKEQEYAIDL